MIQFNLLPDVKIEYLKAVRVRRIISVISVSIGSVVMIIAVSLALFVYGAQKTHLNNLSKDIERDSKILRDIPELDKILTIQNQLSNLTPLHEEKAAISRLRTYISQITPADVSYAKIEVDTIDKTMSFSGSADSLRTINQFVDTIKFTKFTVDGEEKNAFSNVVLTSFGRDEKGASYQIDLVFDELIFDNTVGIQLSVPSITSTRSVQQRPVSDGLFQPLSNPESQLPIPEENE